MQPANANYMVLLLFFPPFLFPGQIDITCDLDGDLRLFGGTSELNGRVEICFRGYWGTICDDQWDDNDATVVCRQIGHSNLGKLPGNTQPSY